MPHMRKQNKNKNRAGYGNEKFSAVLPEMQTGNIDRCRTLFDKSRTRYRAGRVDAEPIIGRMIVCCASFCFKDKFLRSKNENT